MAYNPQVANPFFVAPPDLSQGLAGLGSAMQNYGIARTKQEKEKETQEKIAQATELHASGDRKGLADFFIANPEIHEMLMEPFQFQSDETQRDFFQSTLKMRDVIANDPTDREGMQRVVQERDAVLDRWGVPQSQRMDSKEFLEPGGTYDQLMAEDPTGKAAVDFLEDIAVRGAPDLWKAYDDARGGGEGAGGGATWGLYQNAVNEGWRPQDGSEPTFLKFQTEWEGIKDPKVKYQKMGDPTRLRDADGKVYEKQTWVNPYDPSDTKVVVSDPVSPGEETLVGEYGLTTKEEEEEKAEVAIAKTGEESLIRVKEAKDSVIAKKQGERGAAAIDEAITAADGMAGMRRAIALANEVETGGIGFVKNKIQKIFGTQSEDQGELENLMGQAVLKQLKPIFGAQFTKAEGDLLHDMEANFKKSGRVNAVLLKKALKLMEMRVAKGRKIAEERKDTEALGLIDVGVNFRFDDFNYDDTGERIIKPREPAKPGDTIGGIKLIE